MPLATLQRRWCHLSGRRRCCRRLADLRLLVLDVDGVLTDGGLWTTENGEVIKRFDVRDGLGIRLLQQAGLEVAWLSGGKSGATEQRARYLGIRHVLTAVKDKPAALAELQSSLGLSAAAQAGSSAEPAEAQGGWLSPEQRQALVRLEAAGRERLGETRCGQCRQCLPCPREVPIPALLRLRNLAVGHGMSAFASERYSLIGRAGHWWEQVDASACERCGDCLPRCPLQLAIPDLLADTHQRLAAPPRRRLWG